MNNQIKLNHKINLSWLIAFAMPTIFSSIFANLYSTVDGVFIARWVDTNALSATNIAIPLVYFSSGLGMMFGTGGNALVAKKIGENREEEARQDFSLLLLVAFLFCVVLTVVFLVFLDPLCRFLGSDDMLLPYCRQYMIPLLIGVPFTVFGMVFRMSFITVGKAGLGAALSVIGGVLNIVLDWLFISVFGWGLAGAAIATTIGYAFPSVVGTAWFFVNRKRVLHIVRPKWNPDTIIKSCINGSSEMVGILAYSVVTILFNRILMNIAGADGVASLTIIWYAQGLFSGLFYGYISGISSVISYNFGRRDKERLNKTFKLSLMIIGVTAVVVTVLSYMFGGYVVNFFAKGNKYIAAQSLHGFRIAAISFAVMAYNSFASGWFTALNDGKTSAILSFCRTFVFMILPVLILPNIFGIDGVWYSLAAGEFLSLIMTIYYFIKFKDIWKS